MVLRVLGSFLLLYIYRTPPPMMPQISKTQALKKKKTRRATGKSDDCPVIKLVLCKKKHKVNTKKNQDEASLMTAL